MQRTHLQQSVKTLVLATTVLAASSAAQSTLHLLPGAAPGRTFTVPLVDMNGDGHADFAVTRDTIDYPEGSVRIHSGADGSVIRDITGVGFATYAGDVNGDGLSDLITGSITPGGGAGAAWVYSGGDGSLLFQVDGEPALGWHFGQAASAAGDVNADGFDDFVVSAWDDTSHLSTVFSGVDASVLLSIDTPGLPCHTIGDANGDGYDDFASCAYASTGEAIAYSGRDGSQLWAVHRSSFDLAGPYFTNFGVAAAGDINRDGYDDIAISKTYEFGSHGGACVLSGLDGSVLRQYPSTAHPEVGQYDGFGRARACGDVNGDGHADLAISATFESTLVTEGGSIRVYSGIDGSLLHTIHGTVPGGDLGYASGRVGFDVDNDGFDDVAAGTHASIAYVFDVGATGSPGRLRPHGNGCVGSNGRLPTMGVRGLAQLGDAFRVSLNGGIDNGNAFLFAGVPGNLSLAPLGHPECTMYMSPFMSVPTPLDGEGWASCDLAVSNDPTQLGLAIELQWLTLDPGIAPLAIRLSDGLFVEVGQ